jgi:secondary thiamine-phosphate synthase enzyme
MKVKLTSIKLRSTAEFQLIKITEDVHKFVSESGIKDGVVFVISAHTTTGIMINESLECVETDIEEALERLVPKDAPYAHAHFLPSYGTTGGNSPGHLKSMLTGNHCVLPVQDGKVVGGHAQDIYFAEYDGLKIRTVYIEVMGG